MFSLQLKRIKAPVPVEHSTRGYANTIYIVKEAFRPQAPDANRRLGLISDAPTEAMDKQKQRQDTKTYRRWKDKGTESKQE